MFGNFGGISVVLSMKLRREGCMFCSIHVEIARRGMSSSITTGSSKKLRGPRPHAPDVIGDSRYTVLRFPGLAFQNDGCNCRCNTLYKLGGRDH